MTEKLYESTRPTATLKVTLDPAGWWELRPTQEKVIAALETLPDMGMVAFIGVLGGGKTWLLCRIMLGYALKYPGFRGFIGRQYEVDLEETTRKTWRDLLGRCQYEVDRQVRPTGIPEGDIPQVARYVKHDQRYTFANGSVVMFGALERGHEKYKSLEIHAYGLDEASQISEEAALILHGRIRAPSVGSPRFGLAVSNPSSKLHWLYDWFVRQPRPGHLLFRAGRDENAVNLPPGYYDTLREKYTPEMIRRYLEGEWGDIGAGDPVFPTFHPSVHVQSRPLVKGQPLLVGIDYGYQSPGVVWAQKHGLDRLHFLRAWSPKRLDAYQLGQGIRANSHRWWSDTKVEYAYFAGVDGNTRKDTAQQTSSDILAGVLGQRPFAKYHAVERGWNILRHLMERTPAGEPRLTVEPHESTTALVETFDGGLRYRPDREDEVEKTGIYDPLADACRYIAVHTFPAVQAGQAKAVPFFRRERTRSSQHKVIIGAFQ